MTLSDPDPGFKVTVVLKGEYLQNDAFYRHSYYRTLIGNHKHFRYPCVTRDPNFKRHAGLSATAGLSCLFTMAIAFVSIIFEELKLDR